MKLRTPWCFSHPTTAATSRERNCSWMAASHKYRPLLDRTGGRQSVPYQPAPFLSANSKDESMTVISVIVGITREGRFSEKPATWILQHLKKREGVDARLLDLRDFPTPFFDQPATPATPGRPPYKNEDRAEMDGRDRAVRQLRLRHPRIQLRTFSGAKERNRLGLSRVEPQSGCLRELWLSHGRTQRPAAPPDGDRASTRADPLIRPHPCRHLVGSLPGRRCRRWTGRARGACQDADR